MTPGGGQMNMEAAKYLAMLKGFLDYIMNEFKVFLAAVTHVASLGEKRVVSWKSLRNPGLDHK